ncbi:hypothetical protein PHLCEN_2v9745 [Hermanssonia centrifuga]|uniref:Fungal ligninase C-terminal domain-containing protein n=1 Tax=Hermanssonia centrifuga TaxID=98765 RepID=A0A2R6NPY2_9APHY|nr:hypothetical protein PHLCEN_2v9745 [Hermanssonia centrifuga]
MSLLGQNVDDLIDCSEVITSLTSNTVLPAFLPAGKTAEDIDQACPDTAFPSLTVQPGPAISIPPM